MEYQENQPIYHSVNLSDRKRKKKKKSQKLLRIKNCSYAICMHPTSINPNVDVDSQKEA